MKLKIIALGIAMALAATPGYARAAGMAGGSAHGGGFAHGGFAHGGGFAHHGGFAHSGPHGFRDHRSGVRDHRFGPSFGGDFGVPFFDSFGYQPEYAEPDIVAPESPSGFPPPAPSAEPAQNECPVAAHADHAHRGPLAEAAADRHERVGQVVVIRPGCADEIVSVPAG